MADATAQLSNYRQSPRKVGRVVSFVRGKHVVAALAALEVIPNRPAAPNAKLIRSAVANAKSNGLSIDELVISKIIVGKGVVFRRSMPRARGSSAVIRKKASHVTIELTRVAPKEKKTRTAKKTKPAVSATE
jgi:large subunit ribosomal protein L22